MNFVEKAILPLASPSFIALFRKASIGMRSIGTIIILLAQFSLTAQNPIPAENSLAGNPSTEWEVSGSGDPTIQGFATDISVNKGQTIRFKVNISGTNKNFSIRVYRLGYYQGNGARLITTIGPVTGVTQPSPIVNTATGLVDCGNWTESASWAVPATAVSGVYIARLIRQDNGGASHMVFIVRDDAANADILFKTSDATWQAYNNYGGYSLYNGSTTYAGGHAVKVSYNRPFLTRAGGGGGGASMDWLFNAEYPMIRWLERNGYYVNYATDVDMERNTTPITLDKNRILLSVGHDEYWSAAERSRFEQARENGVHIAFFSGNEVYWKTRWENSVDASNTPYRTLVCYKEGTLGEYNCNGECDPTTFWTGLWRDGCNAVAATDGCNLENKLTGQIGWYELTGSIQVPYENKNHRFWRNTSVAALAPGQTATLPSGTLGYEWDYEQPAYASSNPPGRMTLSSSTYNGYTHKLSLYRHPSGSLVFGSGTVQWSWGLDDKHDRGNAPPSAIMQQATVNLFADMGVQPATLQAGLVAATASADIMAPETIIINPLTGTSVAANTTLTISGTCTDDNTVAAVEISIDGGLTWRPVTGTTNWTYTWTPTVSGTVSVKVRGIDDSGNMESVPNAQFSNSITLNVGQEQCPCTIWSPTTIPAVVQTQDAAPVELGVKFRSLVNGYIKGIRFYKSGANTGKHIGNLWTSSGTNLARVTFTNESSSGWQEMSFANPVAITAGTTYIASYFTPTGYYSSDDYYFSASGKSTSYLVALQTGVDGPNGVYKYDTATAFPISSFNATNYFVDVVFVTTTGPDLVPPAIISVIPANAASGVEVTQAMSVTFNESLDPLTVNSSTVQLRNASNQLVSAAVSYLSGSKTIVITPSLPLDYSSNYSLLLKGGSGTSVIKDVAGNIFFRDTVFTFSTRSKPLLPYQGPGGPILVVGAAGNPFSYYAAEILRAEGFNSFATVDITTVNATLLSSYDVVVLGQLPLSSTNITDLTNWANAGGTLIAFKPDAGLYSLMGINAATGSLSEGYILVDNTTASGKGIVNRTMQYHGASSYYTLNGATKIASLYSNATTATTYSAVTMKSVGTNGGWAIAFSYDLAKSIIYTRQGNPLWSGQERDGRAPIRSDDLFYSTTTSWLDFSKVSIPQADEQQHLLSNLIHYANLKRKPLPRMWFLPKGLKAAVVMTGDDHSANGKGTMFRFNRYKDQSPSNTQEAVANWEAVRASSYIFPGTPITPDELLQMYNDGFEVGLHLNTGCANFTAATWSSNWNAQMASLKSQLPGLSAQKTHRTHCIAFSDYATQPKKEAELGIRIDDNYYYWPGTWVLDRPGMFTGSGMPMRFADSLGNMIDIYQVVTQITDESDQNHYKHITSLLDSALGTPGYYGVFCANLHTDNVQATAISGSDIIVKEALARSVPVVSAAQMADWLDGRNASYFKDLTWNNNQLTFSIEAVSGSRNMRAMLPLYNGNLILSKMTYNGQSIELKSDIIKGIPYAFFDATLGKASYVATYAPANKPVISEVSVVAGLDRSATINWKTDVFSNSKVDYGTSAATLSQSLTVSNPVIDHKVRLTNLLPGTTYYYRVSSQESISGLSATVTTGVEAPLMFVMPGNPCAVDSSAAQFSLGTVDTSSLVALQGTGAIILKPRVNDEFSGTVVTATNWASATYNNNGTTVVAGGQVTVNGARLSSVGSYSSGSMIEFEATFNSAANQGIGFSNNANFSTTQPWIVLGQPATADGNLYIRTSDNQAVSLGTSLLGTKHRYSIIWLPGGKSFSFYVDGNFIATITHSGTLAAAMYVQVSDNNNSSGSLAVDWMRIGPYRNPGTFTSRIFDYGITATWNRLNWVSTAPEGSLLVVQARTGNSAVPDATWSTFAPVNNGDSIKQSGRYLQYRALLSTSNSSFTPTLRWIAAGCKDVNSAITVQVQPLDQNKCDSGRAEFIAKAASGTSTVIQWQTSRDGRTWTDITAANKDTLAVLASSATAGSLYRAVWTNKNDKVTSNVATLRLNRLKGTVTSITNVKCNGASTGSFTIAASGGLAPYTYSIDTGRTVQSVGAYSNLKQGAYSLQIKDAAGCKGDTVISISQPAPLQFASTNKLDVSCNAASTGVITVAAQGGVSPYTYNINNGLYQSSGSFTGLLAGSYSVSVKDSNNCITSQSLIITQPALLTSAVQNQTSVNCNGGNNGTFTIQGQGGTIPYQYRIDGGAYQSTGFFIGLIAKNYIVTVKDSNGCTTDKAVTITQPSVLRSTITSQVAVKCNGGSDGAITLAGQGGSGTYQYRIDGGLYQSDGIFTGLSARSYVITVKDVNGCTGDTTVTITQPSVLSSIISSQTAVKCNGGNDGTFTIVGQGGTIPYQYRIDSGTYQSSGLFSGLLAKNYFVSVKDANGCTAQKSLTITQPSVLSSVISSQTAVKCNGGSDGAITFAGQGGSGTYQYRIDGGVYQFGGTFTGLLARSYIFSIKDVNGCTIDTSVTITQPSVLSSAISSQTFVKCNGGNDGALTMVGQGGSSPYQYSIDGGAYQSNGFFTGLVAKNYIVAVKDANGCITEKSVTLTQPSVLSSAVISLSAVKCNGGNDGSMTITGQGGTSPYQYRIDGGIYQSAGTFSGLLAKAYVITVKDVNGCTTDLSVNISQPSVLSSALTAQSNVKCFGGNDGALTITGQGGTAPYQYRIDGGTYEGTGVFSGLTAKTYIVTIVDVNGCTAERTGIITQPALIGTTVTSQMNVKCNGGNDGSLTLIAQGGTSPYQYSINSATYQGTGAFAGLFANSYTISVKDANGCTAEKAVQVTQPPLLTATILNQKILTCYGGNDGNITIEGQGGTGPYQYRIDGGAYQANGFFAGLVAKNYIVTVKDANGCITEKSVTLTQPSVLSSAVISQSAVKCNGGSDGSMTITGQGGTSPYQYRIDGGVYQSAGAFSGLLAKAYVISVKDVNGCTTDLSVNISQPSVLSSVLTAQSNVKCFGGNDGALTITGQGGTAPYGYSLNGINYQDSTSFNNLNAGNYIINTKDANNCVAVTNVLLTEPAKLNLSAVSQKGATCKGSASGSVVLIASGGTSSYQYVLNGGSLQASGTFEDLQAGSYTALVKDGNSCSATYLFTISEPDSLKAVISNKKDIECWGNATGSFTLTGYGGTAPYQYSFNNGLYSGVNTFSTLSAGTYTVLVKDANGCIYSQPVAINTPQVLSLTASSVVNVDCKGNNTGSLSLQGIGGIAPYTYSINEDTYINGSTFSSLTANTYYVSVKDANGCVSGKLFRINEPEYLSLSLNKVINVYCKGNNTGQAYLSAFGGTSPYQYKLNGGSFQMGEYFSNLNAGSYTVTVKDSLGCQTAQSFTITEPDALKPFVAAVSEPKCAGLNTGTITASATGGVAPYIYNINGGNYQSSNVFTSLTSNSYLIYVKDANGCSQPMSVALTEPAPIRVLINKDALPCLESTNGSYSVFASGGVAPLKVSGDGGTTFQVNSVQLNGLTAGTYPVKIVDANSCVKDTSVQIDVDKAIWTGKQNSDWHNAGNWSTGRVPSSQTHVIIIGGTPNNCVISNADVTVASIQVRNNAPLQVINDRKIYIAGKCVQLPAD